MSKGKVSFSPLASGDPNGLVRNMISTTADTATSQATSPPALPTAPPLPDPPQPTESAADVVAKADSILTSIHKFQRNLLDSKIANDTSMITYYQNQIGIYKSLLLVVGPR